MKWRYSLRWKLPSPCPGPHELASEVVEAGQPAPESIMSRWVAGAGYAVCVDFPDERQIKRWSDERKAAARRRNLERRVNRMGMLTASWLLCREQHATERLIYGALWAIMVLLMNINDVSESVAGVVIALLTLMVCSSVGKNLKRFWPRHFFVMFYAVHLAVLGIVATM